MAVFGFIGTGNMGGALARAAAKKEGAKLLLANRTAEKAETLAKELGATAVDNGTAAARADYLLLGVKPQMMADMLDTIAPVLQARDTKPVLVTMAAGMTMEKIRMLAGGCCPVVRIMPNTPVSIGMGTVLYCVDAGVTEAQVTTLTDTFAAAGSFYPVAEHLMDAGSAVSGCGPAFVDLFMEAMADGGVACGLPRSLAQSLAAETVRGSAALALATGKGPAELKDAVCSPGGTTIQGVRALENGGLRAAVMEAVIAAFEKNRDFR